MNKNKYNKSAQYTLAFYLLGMSIFGGIVLIFLSFIIQDNEDLLLTLGNTGIYLSILIPSVYFAREMFVDDFKKFKDNGATFTLIIVLTIILLFVFNAAVSIVYEVFNLSTDTSNQDSIESILISYPAIMAFTVIVLGPIVEELLFRFSFFTLFDNVGSNDEAKKKSIIRPIAYIAISSLIFGSVHVIGDPQFFNIFIYAALGVPFAIGYFLSNRNIYVALIPHMLWNALSVIISISGM